MNAMADNPENGTPPQPEAPVPGGAVEHLNIKVTDNNNEVFFKIKRSTKLDKLMTAFCERQGKTVNSVRFLFEGQRVQPSDTPDTVCGVFLFAFSPSPLAPGPWPPLPLPRSLFLFYQTQRWFLWLTNLVSLWKTSSKCKTVIPWKFTKSKSVVLPTLEETRRNETKLPNFLHARGICHFDSNPQMDGKRVGLKGLVGCWVVFGLTGVCFLGTAR